MSAVSVTLIRAAASLKDLSRLRCIQTRSAEIQYAVIWPAQMLMMHFRYIRHICRLQIYTELNHLHSLRVTIAQTAILQHKIVQRAKVYFGSFCKIKNSYSYDS